MRNQSSVMFFGRSSERSAARIRSTVIIEDATVSIEVRIQSPLENQNKNQTHKRSGRVWRGHLPGGYGGPQTPDVLMDHPSPPSAQAISFRRVRPAPLLSITPFKATKCAWRSHQMAVMTMRRGWRSGALWPAWRTIV